MPSKLSRSSPAQINALSGGLRAFVDPSTMIATGGTPLIELRTVPDGSGESLACITSDAGATAGWDLNLPAVARTGRLALMVYLDDFLVGASAATATPDNSVSNFNNVQATIVLDLDGAFGAGVAYKQEVMLTRGWNHVVLGRNHRDAPSRNVAATVSPSLGGVGADSHMNSGTASTSSSLWDAPMQRIRVVVSGLGGSLRTRIFFREVVDNANYNSRTCFIFDDAYAGVFTNAFPIMRALGLVGVVAVISSLVGTAGYMTWAQIRTLRDAGWDVINHTNTHPTASAAAALSLANITAEITICRDAIIANGCNVRNSANYFVAPQGGFLRMDATNYRQALTDAGVYASFGTVNRCTGPQLLNKQYIPRMNFNTYNDVTGYGISEVVTQYEMAVRNGCSPMVMLHDVLVNPGADGKSNDVKLLDTEFQQLCVAAARLQNARFTTVCGVTSAIPQMFTTDRALR